MNFLLDDSLGLDTVKQFCKGGFNVLAYVARHHKKEQIIPRLEKAFFSLGNDGKNSRLFFHLAADGVHFSSVVRNAYRCYRGMIPARPCAHNAIVHQHHAHVVGEAGAGFEFLKSFVNVHKNRLGFIG